MVEKTAEQIWVKKAGHSEGKLKTVTEANISNCCTGESLVHPTTWDCGELQACSGTLLRSWLFRHKDIRCAFNQWEGGILNLEKCNNQE